MNNALQQLTALLGKKPYTINRKIGPVYEWDIPCTTVDRMSQEFVSKLRRLGAAVFNVDCSHEPYYFVCIRL